MTNNTQTSSNPRIRFTDEVWKLIQLHQQSGEHPNEVIARVFKALQEAAKK